MIRTRCLLSAPLFAALSGLATAGPAHADDSDDRFTLRLGAMDTDGSGRLHASGSAFGRDVTVSEDFDFGKKEVSPRVSGLFRFGERQRLIFDYFRYRKSDTAVLANDLGFDGDVIPAGSHAAFESRFQTASLLYDYTVVDAPRFSMGLQIGAEWAKADGKLYAEAGALNHTERAREDGKAPVVGLRFTGKPGEHWLLNLQGQYLDADWGDFDYSGKIKRANAIVEYRFGKGFGVFAGYDWYKINYHEDGRDASGGVDLTFKGPIAGLSFAF